MEHIPFMVKKNGRVDNGFYKILVANINRIFYQNISKKLIKTRTNDEKESPLHSLVDTEI